MHLLHDPVAQMLPSAVIVGEVEGLRSDGALGLLQIRRYSAAHFHWLTAEYFHHIELLLPKSPAARENGADTGDPRAIDKNGEQLSTGQSPKRQGLR
ncbi:MAG TPA: hypothetical protein VNO24_10880 [Blastocatellia bacterium]|nr:hypothetical protein [Blastocatellia bacterium]